MIQNKGAKKTSKTKKDFKTADIFFDFLLHKKDLMPILPRSCNFKHYF